MSDQLDAWVDELAHIGGDGRAVNRFAWSPHLLEAGRWLCDRARELELDAEIDAAGNVVARWGSGGDAVAVGSHLDTVPDGGAFDGALGVLSGLESIRRLRAEGFVPSRPIWLLGFTDEEGTRFGTSMFGSRAFAGEDLTSLGDRRDVEGVTVAEAMHSAGFDFAAIGQAGQIGRVNSYLELHIEQGPRMEEAGLEVSVVSGIVGMAGYRVHLTGVANHAGTTPMAGRQDALAGASQVVLALRDHALRCTGRTANVGRIGVEPAGANVIPGTCTFTVDLRGPDEAGMADWDRLLRETVQEAADAEGLVADIEPQFVHKSAACDPRLRNVLTDEADRAGLCHEPLLSGAGHDAQVLARHVPVAMVFVPSLHGISHTSQENTLAQWREPGVQVLTAALRQLTSG
jgi:hydantoinase/carbamoylase family amidase